MALEDWRDVLGEGLAVKLELPVAPSERTSTPSDTAAHLLDAIAILEDRAQGYAMDDPPSPEFQRLELKIDLLTDLVSSLLANSIPKRASVTISCAGLVIPAALLPVDTQRIEFYPCHWLAQPVILEVGEVKCRGEACGASWRSPDHGLRDALARWVFRMHRQDVARQRMRGGAARMERPVSAKNAVTDPDGAA